MTTLDWLAQTKLMPPLLRGDVIARPRLLTTLAQALADHPLTLLSTPAGSGKTTLLASLAGIESHPPLLNAAVAWLSLDEEDDDPTRFFAGLIGALQQLGPAVDAALRPQLALLPQLSADPRRLAAAVVNALVTAHPAPALLILDDLHHLAAPPIFAALDALLERPPPLLRVLVATRTDPPLSLTRLRARRQIFELRLDELRFTADETAELLRRLCRVALPAPQLAQLHRRTEGWAAGLSMLASSLDRIEAPDDRAAFLAQLQQTDHYIFEFLAEEVLNRQGPATRAFLLETAVLAELTPARCRAITGHANAPAILDTLYRRNLFLTQVRRPSAPAGVAAAAADDEATYRYHDLFREFLLARLAREAPEWLRTLHQRAADAEPNQARRIQHLLDAGLWDKAEASIVSAGPALLNMGAYSMLAGWIDSMPPERGVAPWLLYLRGICAWEHYQLDSGGELMGQARRRFAELGDERGYAAATVQLATMRLSTGAWAMARALADEALALGAQLSADERVRILGLRANLRFTDGDVAGGLADLDETLAVAEAADDPAACLGLLEHSAAGPTTALPGALARLARIEALLSRLRQPTESAVGLHLLEIRAYATLWSGRWSETLAACSRLYSVCEQLGVPAWRMIEIGAVPPLCQTILGDHEAADAGFAELFAIIEGLPPTATPLLEVPFRFWLARARWLQGRHQELRAAYERILAIDLAYGAHPFTEAVRPLLRALLALAEGDHEAAVAELQAALAIQERQRISVIFSDARLLLAHALLLQGRRQEALAAAEPALVEWAAEGAPGHLLWEGAPVVPVLRLAAAQGRDHGLAARILPILAPAEPIPHAAPAGAAIPGSPEGLTSRELEVLRLMVAGARNGEIAERLVISPHTVKNHVKNILAKLDARSRTEAAARARELGLL